MDALWVAKGPAFPQAENYHTLIRSCRCAIFFEYALYVNKFVFYAVTGLNFPFIFISLLFFVDVWDGESGSWCHSAYLIYL